VAGEVGAVIREGIVVEGVVVLHASSVRVRGDGLWGGDDGGVVADEHPPFLAFQGSAGDLGELGPGNELGYLRPGDLPAFLVGEGDLLPQQDVLLGEPVAASRQTSLLVLVPALNVRPRLDLSSDVLPALPMFLNQRKQELFFLIIPGTLADLRGEDSFPMLGALCSRLSSS